MINLKRSGYVIRIAYWHNDYFEIPRQTSLCVVFWRVVLGAVLPAVVIGLLIAVFIAAMLQVPSKDLLQFFLFFFTAILLGAAGVAAIFGVGWLLSEGPKVLERKLRDSVDEHPILHGLWEMKKGFCPIVQIERD